MGHSHVTLDSALPPRNPYKGYSLGIFLMDYPYESLKEDS